MLALTLICWRILGSGWPHSMKLLGDADPHSEYDRATKTCEASQHVRRDLGAPFRAEQKLTGQGDLVALRYNFLGRVQSENTKITGATFAAGPGYLIDSAPGVARTAERHTSTIEDGDATLSPHSYRAHCDLFPTLGSRDRRFGAGSSAWPFESPRPIRPTTAPLTWHHQSQRTNAARAPNKVAGRVRAGNSGRSRSPARAASTHAVLRQT